eukprot:6204017-Pleurochrysis_carterae.AAC.3
MSTRCLHDDSPSHFCAMRESRLFDSFAYLLHRPAPIHLFQAVLATACAAAFQVTQSTAH